MSVPCSSSLIVKGVRFKCSSNTTETNCFAEVAAKREEEHWSLSIPIQLSFSRSSAVQLWSLELRRHRMCLALLPYAIGRNTIRERARGLTLCVRHFFASEDGFRVDDTEPLKIGPPSPRRQSAVTFHSVTCPPCHLPPLLQRHLSLFLPVSFLVLYCPLSHPAVDRRYLSRLSNPHTPTVSPQNIKNWCCGAASPPSFRCLSPCCLWLL